MIAKEIAEKVVRPIKVDGECVGLFVGEDCKFILPVAPVFGGVTEIGWYWLMLNVREVIEHAVNMSNESVSEQGEGNSTASSPADSVGR